MTPFVLNDLRKIPSMGGASIGEYLYELGRNHQGKGDVVEVGSWLGSSCAHMALGLQDSHSKAVIHCYDRFQSSFEECEKAAAYGVALKEGQDTLPLFLENVTPIYPHIKAHKGSIEKCRWEGRSIEIYIDDAAKEKKQFLHILKTFGPSFIPGLTTVVLMDYNMYQKQNYPTEKREILKAQMKIMANLGDYFRQIYSAWPRSSAVSFIYEKACPFDRLKD